MKKGMSVTLKIKRRVGEIWRRAGSPPVVLCISGGVDSVVLLSALREVVPSGAPLIALHCNFHLRGEESERDCRFVERLCSDLGVPLKVRDFDVEAYRKEHKCSLEMACRELRYAWFREEASCIGHNTRIVTGHHADDNIETLLLNLFRGAGVMGLKGMLPDNDGILRPLLEFSRMDIMTYAEENGLEYVTDSTNLSSDYRRNFIRNELLPLVESRWPGVRKSLLRSQEVMREEAAIVREATDDVVSSPISLPLEILRNSAAPSVYVYGFIAPHGGNTEQVRSIVSAVDTQPFVCGKVWPLPDGCRVSLERDYLEILPSDNSMIGATPVFCWGKVKLSDDEVRKMKEDRSNMCAWLPRPPECYTLRRVRRGDRIRPLGMKGSRLLSDVMKDARMSLSEKEAQWVLVDAATDEIIWAPGLRRSRLDLVAPDADSCYFVSLNR